MKLNSNIILISGKSRSGKNTASTIIKETYEKKGYKVCELQIAYYLKDYISRFFGWDLSEETKPRELLQTFGTDLIRVKLGKEMFFINRTIEDIEILSEYFDLFIINDIRFPLEINSIKEVNENTKVINVKRLSDELSSSEKSHITETALNEFSEYDVVINNDKTIEYLENEIKNIIDGGNLI